MRMGENEKLLAAAALLKDNCDKRCNCGGCPFADADDCCVLTGSVPGLWKIRRNSEGG